MTPDERQWSRFTPAQRLGRTISYLVMAAAIVWALRTVAIIPEFLMDAPEQMADLFRRMWPIDWSHYYQADEMGVHHALVETLHIASLGTILAVVLALPALQRQPLQAAQAGARPRPAEGDVELHIDRFLPRGLGQHDRPDRRRQQHQ